MLNITHYQRNANQDHNGVTSHTGQNGCYPKVYKQQMLERVWRKENPLTLLVGIQTSTASMENSVGFLKKLEIELLYDPAIPLLGIHTEETRSERDMCTPMFIAALFTIARTWKKPGCPSADPGLRFHRASVQFSHSVVSDSLQPHESQHTRPPCPSPTPGVHSRSRPLRQ